MVLRTSVIITYPLMLLARADEILVLRTGQAVEGGCHRTLLQIGGSTARFGIWGNRS